RPFDLATGPLLRVHVLRLGAEAHALVLVLHHIVADGWSMSVLFRELGEAYAAYRSGGAPAWPALPVQYADYALWQRGWLDGAELERQLGYWRRQLAGAPAQLALPADRPRPPVQTHRGARVTHRISATVTEALKDLGRAHGCTLFMVLLAAFDAVLARCSGQADIVVGTPVAGRGRTELEGLIGFFVNTLVLRVDLGGDPGFDTLLARVRRVALDAYAHQDVPFEKLVDDLRPERDPGRTPVFQVMFNLHNEPARAPDLSGLEVETVGVDRRTAKFDLAVSLQEFEQGLFTHFEYNTDLFDRETVEYWSGYLERVLEAVVADPGVRLSGLPVLAGGATAGLPAARLPAGDDLVSAFAAQVAAAPRRVAVRSASHSLSYGTLDERSDRVSAALRSLGLAGDGHAARVGLLAGQDAPMVTGLLGILKSGCAYVPLEPWQPAGRLAALAAEAGVSAIVCDAAHAGLAAERFGALPVIDVGSLAAVPRPAAAVPGADALAYIIYTSGTSGAPKGVMQTHGGALAQVRRYCAGLGLGPDDRVSLLSGYGFDAAVQDVFGALLTGASLYPLDVRGAADAGSLVDALVAARMTVVHATPTVYRHLFGGELHCDQDLSAVRAVVLGGEVVRRSDFELYRSRFAPGSVLVNGFGLTESTMGLQYVADHDTRVLGQQLPVGRAVPGLEVGLFDAGGAASWHGEIRLRGAGVFAGYWGEAQRTVARRTADGWYCTGDSGRRLPDGTILYTGRLDEQLKVRGQRVEPGAIEAVLGGLAGIAECAVRLVERPGGDWLVAYVVPAAGLSAGAAQHDAWRAALGAVLPGYMVPQAFEVLAALPRRSNGKVARERLPAPGTVRARTAVPARTELEAVLTGLWCEVLAAESVGIHDDFFALGGHSLLATRLISRIRDRLGVELPLVRFFEQPTVAKLADAIENDPVTGGLDAVSAVTRRDRRVPVRATGLE
ncbi:MAG: condensation domain-containing protein, partial [Paracoccaceae bacterium]